MGEEPATLRGRCVLAEVDGVVVVNQQCDERRPQWVGPGYARSWSVLLPRSGVFRLRVDGQERLLDPSVANLERPGQELHVSHPAGACGPATRIVMPQDVVERYAVPAAGMLLRSARVDLRHWALVTACRDGVDDFEVADRTWALLRDLLPSGQDRPSNLPYAGRVPRGATQRAHRKLAYDACELLGTGEFTLGLAELAAILGSSASHLSRVFAGVTGRSVTSYRNHLRIQAVVRDIAEGAPSLRTLAARYGFADQAHLTRVMRAHTGHSPSTVRRLLRSVSADGHAAN